MKYYTAASTISKNIIPGDIPTRGICLARGEFSRGEVSNDILEPLAEPRVARLSDISPSIRAHPLFRQGYNQGYSDRVHEEFLADRPADESISGTSAANPPATFDVTAGGLRHRLTPGMRAMRDLSALTTERFVTETPCCGRRIMLAIPASEEALPAVCCHCSVLFGVGLIQEEPDGFGGEPSHVAIFVVEQLDIAAAQHRTGRWERHSGKM